MSTFDTPEPIRVELQLPVGAARIVASDRVDTVVEVVPTDPARRGDVLAAGRASVEYADGRLAVHAARTWRRYSWSSDGGSIDVHVQCPAGSDLLVAGTMTSMRATGRFGRVQMSTSVGELRVDEASAAVLRVAGLGDVTVGCVEHSVEISTGSGAVRVDAGGGVLQVKNSNGDTWVGSVGEDTMIKAANGDITVEAAAGSVTAKTANGHVLLAHVRGGDVVAESGCGRVEVAVAAGTAAWLDLDTGVGQVRNLLDDPTPPAAGEDSVRVRARSGAGDVTVRRAEPAASAPADAKGGRT